MDATLHLGDCLNVLATIPDGSVDAILTDPPYGIDFQCHHKTDPGKRLPKIRNDKRPAVAWIREAARVLAPTGCVIVWHRWDVAEEFRVAMDAAGLKPSAQIVWDRVAHGMGNLTAQPAPQHEVAWFAANPGFRFHGARPKSILRAMRPTATLEHPNQKPAALMESLVRDYCQPGGLVLDPFAGSGSTGQACIRLGRRFVGVELDPVYHAIAQQNLAAETFKVRMATRNA